MGIAAFTCFGLGGYRMLESLSQCDEKQASRKRNRLHEVFAERDAHLLNVRQTHAPRKEDACDDESEQQETVAV